MIQTGHVAGMDGIDFIRHYNGTYKRKVSLGLDGRVLLKGVESSRV
jgi:hypothetical protein